MPDFKLNQTINDATGGDQFNIAPGKIAALRFVFTGTNDAGQTADLDDLGSVKVTRADRQIANISIRQIARILNIERGQNLFSSTTGGAVKASALLEFAIAGDPDLERNALNIKGQGELNFEYIPASTVDTVFGGAGSLQLKVYSQASAYSERFEVRTFTDNQVYSAGLANQLIQLNKANIAKIFMEDPDDVIDLVQVETNERTVLSPVDWDFLESLTLSDNQLEVTTFSMIKIPIYTPQNLASAVNADTNLYLTTSAGGTFPIVTQSLKIWPKPRQ